MSAYVHGHSGIEVCDRWRNFEAFLDDMGERPPGTSIDRIDGNGNYEPDNCRWSTPVEQVRNSKTVKLEVHEVRQIRWLAGTYTQAEIAKAFYISRPNVCGIVARRTWKDVQ